MRVRDGCVCVCGPLLGECVCVCAMYTAHFDRMGSNENVFFFFFVSSSSKYTTRAPHPREDGIECFVCSRKQRNASILSGLFLHGIFACNAIVIFRNIIVVVIAAQ